MKKILLVAMLGAFTFCFSQNFPGEDVELLINKELKVQDVDSNLQVYGYDNFYKNERLKKKYACCDSYNSKYSALVGKTFKVISAEPFIDVIGNKKYKLKIENSDTGVIFFKYDPRYEHAFPFEVIGGLDLPEDFYCKKIEVKKDKFTGEINHFAPIGAVSFMKVVKDSESNIYMNATVYNKSLSVGKKGMFFLLDDGSKLEFPNTEISEEVDDNYYKYEGFEKISNSDIKRLSEHLITDIRLYIYDRSVDEEKALEIQGYLKCLKK